MKSKIILLAMLFMVYAFKVSAQNLVPNYSFEDTIHCPVYGQFSGYVTDWAGKVPGYFSSFCNDPGYGGSPSNVWGFQYPHTGNAYAGIYTFARADSGSSLYKTYHNSRDYIQDSLTSILQLGMKYYVTFYLNLGDSVKYACNNIGAYFSDSSLNFSSRKVLSYHTPQVTNDTLHNPLLDKVNWMKISGSFIAKGGEQYIIIGNFIDDAHSDTTFVNSLASIQHTWNASYYYIDDVIVTTDSNYADSLLTAVKSINQSKEVVTVYPNPSTGLFTFNLQSTTQDCTIEIYNMLGENVYNSHFSATTTQVDLTGRPAGVYLYRVVTGEGEAIASGKLVIE